MRLIGRRAYDDRTNALVAGEFVSGPEESAAGAHVRGFGLFGSILRIVGQSLTHSHGMKEAIRATERKRAGYSPLSR